MKHYRILPAHQSLVVLLLLFIASSSFSQVSIIDDLQRTVILRSPAQRIVSLAPSITETLFAVGAGDQIVGVTDYCNYPAEAKTKQRVGGVINPNIETIISLKPDLIVLSMEGNVREDFNKLTGFGIPVFVTNPRSLDGIYTSISQLGTLTGRAAQAMTVVHSLKTRADSIVLAASASKRHTVLLFVSLQPVIVVGQGTFLAELISLAGGVNTAAKASSTYPAYSREAVLKDNPDVLIFLSDVLSDPAGLIHLYPEWSTLNAYRQKKIFRIDSDIVSRPGPRAIEGLEALHKLIH
ncbi:MAG: cobalamin-binding protein [Bacteroidetes bacterium]|nr:cobalamin-binding protein [Bacteroidota bacterium]MCW5894649.1 cobalamin-binding protein [Bacteroidota bacterium]